MSPAARRVGDLATLVRSKNAGPFWLTLDIFCGSDEVYDTLAADGVVTAERVAALYRVDPASVRIFRLADLRVIKVSFPRPVPQGAPGERDMHAGQQHVPLARLELLASRPALARLRAAARPASGPGPGRWSPGWSCRWTG